MESGATRLQKMLQSGEEPAWPLKISLRELPLALSAAHDFGKVRSFFFGHFVRNGSHEKISRQC